MLLPPVSIFSLATDPSDVISESNEAERGDIEKKGEKKVKNGNGNADSSSMNGDREVKHSVEPEINISQLPPAAEAPKAEIPDNSAKVNGNERQRIKSVQEEATEPHWESNAVALKGWNQQCDISQISDAEKWIDMRQCSLCR